LNHQDGLTSSYPPKVASKIAGDIFYGGSNHADSMPCDCKRDNLDTLVIASSHTFPVYP
jgi:hypothetical protein